MFVAVSALAQLGPARPPSLSDRGPSRPARQAEKPPAAAVEPTSVEIPVSPVASEREPISEDDLKSLTVSPEAEAAYRIGPGDGLAIKVLRHEEFEAEGDVTPHGTFLMPILDEVEVSGLTASELDERLTEVIGRDYLVSTLR